MMSWKERLIPHEPNFVSEAFADTALNRRLSFFFRDVKKFLYLRKISEWLGAIYLRRPK